MSDPFLNMNPSAAPGGQTLQQQQAQDDENREIAERIWSEHLNDRREAVEAALGSVLNEKDIVPTSRPFIEVILKGMPPQSEYLLPFYVENANFMHNNKEFPKGGYVATYGAMRQENAMAPMITSAQFDGITIGTRRGTININDPYGVWPEIIGNVSRFSNGVGRGVPNIEIQFGWLSLKDKTDGRRDNLQRVWGIINETNFEMDENGLMKLTIHFIESAISYLKGLKFLEFLDMFKTDPSTEGVDDEKKSPDELLSYITEHTSIGKQLAKSKTLLRFGKCSQEEEDALKMEEYSVTYGDSFYSKMNAIIAKSRPPEEKADLEEFDWAYKIVRQRSFKIDYAGGTGYSESFGSGDAAFSANIGDIVTEIVYDWEPTPKPTDDSKAGPASQFETTNNAILIGYLNWRPDHEGDDRVYDWGLGRSTEAPIDKSKSKDVLSLSIDLSTLNSLFARVGAEIDSILTDFDNQDWEYIKQNIDEAIGGLNVENQTEDILISPSDLQRIRSKGVFGWDWTRRNIENEEDFEARRKSFENLMSKGPKDRSESPVVSQIRALIARNVFKAKATIIGDPAFGSLIEPMSAYFISNFMAPTYFSQYFSGKGWLFSKATHNFSEDGSYRTELELLGQPDMLIPRDENVEASESRLRNAPYYVQEAAAERR